MEWLNTMNVVLIPVQCMIAGFIFAGLPYDPPKLSMRIINITAGVANILAATMNTMDLMVRLQ